MLQRQFEELGFNIIGIQESKSRSNGMWVTGSWIVASTAAEGSKGGCQVWLHTRRFDVAHVAVLSSSFRHLFVATSGKVPMDILVLYAPHSEYPEAEREAWWHLVGSIVSSRRRPAACMLVLADANGLVGSKESSAIGSAFGSEENSSGCYFHEFVLAQKMWVPATWPDSAKGDVQHTFEATNGGRKRIDFIAIDASFPVSSCEAAVLTSVDLMAPRIDHLPVAIRCRLQRRESPESGLSCRRTPPCCDVRAMHDPEGLAEFARLLAGFRLWAPLTVDEHLATVCSFVREAAAACFPRGEARQRNAWISPSTWQLVSRRRAVLNTYLRRQSTRRSACMGAAWQCWRGESGQARCSFLSLSAVRTATMVEAAFVRSTAAVVKRCIREDRTANVAAIAAEAAQADECGDLKTLFSCFRRLGGI